MHTNEGCVHFLYDLHFMLNVEAIYATALKMLVALFSPPPLCQKEALDFHFKQI